MWLCLWPLTMTLSVRVKPDDQMSRYRTTFASDVRSQLETLEYLLSRKQ
jgi:hypothetical protein